MSYVGEGDFLDFVRQKQEADEGIAKSLVDHEEEIAKDLAEAGTYGNQNTEFVEKDNPWVDVTQGKFGKNISVYKHGDGSTFWVTKGDAIVGWVEKRGKKWLARPVGKDEWTGDDFKSAVSQVVGAGAKDDVAPPPGTK